MSDRIRFIKTMRGFSVQETTDNLGSVIQDRDITIFSKINHTHNAVDGGMRLNDAHVLSFGNPAPGTIRMREPVFLTHDLPFLGRHVFNVVQGLRGAGN